MQNTIMVEVAASSGSGEEFNNQILKSETIIQLQLPTKKKRNLPGMPDPDAEVIALSPKSLVATNRFVCEICKKGFQRDQNLQLHRRGHNLPWKLKQRNSKEVVRKQVYVCPEATCINHDPSRALGDLTGIKKHFCRKHGEKKYKCERCSKKYAVRSDWKAHLKTCGTREYPCDCGTLFSRRDSLITHRAFCNALVQESASAHQPQPQPPVEVVPAAAGEREGGDLEAPTSTTLLTVLSPLLSIQGSSSAELPENQNAHLQPSPPPPPPLQPTQGPAVLTTSIASTITITTSSSSTTSGNIPCTGSGVFAGTLNSSTSELSQSSQQRASYSGLLPAMSGSGQPAIDPMSLSLSSSFYGPPSLFHTASQNPQPHYVPSPQPALSATALLQKAAQMGSTSSNSSFLRGLRLALPSSSGPPQHNTSTMASTSASTLANWNNSVKIENNPLASGLGLGLGLGLSSSGSLGLNDLMMGPSMIFGSKPTTLDFLGLGMGEGESSSSGGFSAFLSSIGGGLNMGNDSFGGTWDDSSDQKPSML